MASDDDFFNDFTSAMRQRTQQESMQSRSGQFTVESLAAYPLKPGQMLLVLPNNDGWVYERKAWDPTCK